MENDMGARKRPMLWLLLVVALAGIIGGLLVGRSSDPRPVMTLEPFADLVRDMLRGQTEGPVISIGIAAAAFVIAAVALPVAVVVAMEGLRLGRKKDEDTRHKGEEK